MSLRENDGLVRAFFWISAIAFFLAIVLGLAFWGCTRKKHPFMPGVVVVANMAGTSAAFPAPLNLANR